VTDMAYRPVVLLVDDDPSMRELLATLFSVEGKYRIGGVAADGFEGAMLAMDLKPDVVILDYFMPRWDGSKAAAFIRDKCPDTKILAFSAVLEDPPDWADTFLMKTEIGKLISVCDQLSANGSNGNGH
jgi:DNA-binding NarL/FixJ family response regulator